MNKYLFGFEVHYLCDNCPGAAYDIRRRMPKFVDCRGCPFCDMLDSYFVAERYYLRWQ